jgi:hypothetical protein
MSTSVLLRAAVAALQSRRMCIIVLVLAWLALGGSRALSQTKEPAKGELRGGPIAGGQPGTAIGPSGGGNPSASQPPTGGPEPGSAPSGGVPGGPPVGGPMPGGPADPGGARPPGGGTPPSGGGGGVPTPRVGFGGIPANPGGNFGGFSGAGGFQSLGGGFGFGGFQPQRFSFPINANTHLRDLLPVPPEQTKVPLAWMLTDLKFVPELFFQKPSKLKAPTQKDIDSAKTQEEKQKLTQQINEVRDESFKQAAYMLAKINHLNQKGTDQFVKHLMENRPDLAGLPFMMGDACRMSQNVSRQFISEVSQVRPMLSNPGSGFGGGALGFGGGFAGGGFQGTPPAPNHKPSADETVRAKVAALMQMLAPETAAKRKDLVKKLADMQHRESTRALGQLAVFSQEKDVREAAIAALKHRPRKDYTEGLLHGLRYPWPAFAKNALEAMEKLQRTDMIPTLVEFLDDPDPRAPVTKEVDGTEKYYVREVVRLNHHHNCITCHAPANSDVEFNKNGFSTEFVAAPVSIPGQSLPQPSFSGYGFGGTPLSPDIFVRVDVTYLRQDFSLMQQPPDSMFAPLLQRFDYLVRTREVKGRTVDDYQNWVKGQGARYVSPYHQATLQVLRRMTGRNAEPTTEAWREALGL